MRLFFIFVRFVQDRTTGYTILETDAPVGTYGALVVAARFHHVHGAQDDIDESSATIPSLPMH